jgi:hypothetical protein
VAAAIVISRLMLSHLGWPKVITLSGVYCTLIFFQNKLCYFPQDGFAVPDDEDIAPHLEDEEY